MKLLKIIFLSILFLPYTQTHYRVLCNYGTVPLTATLHSLGCPDVSQVIPPLKDTNNKCALIESGGCCLTGITLSDPKNKYPSRYCPLDKLEARKDLHIMMETGSRMACAATKLSFWNDLKTKTIETTLTSYQKGGATNLVGTSL